VETRSRVPTGESQALVKVADGERTTTRGLGSGVRQIKEEETEGSTRSGGLSTHRSV
jgi:hypothetical protein